jgi:predicted DNA-binding transcriptional regulator YafY
MKERQVKSTNILHIYDRLRQSPVTLDVLHDWVKKAGIDVSRRTLYRYLDDLASSIVFQGEKLVIYENEFNKKVWKIEFDHSEILLSQFDINSYYILRHFIPQSLSQPREGSLKKLDELIYSLASKSRFQMNVDANNLAFTRSGSRDAKYSEKDHVLLEDMIWAIQHHRKIKIEEFNWDTGILPEGFKTGMMVMPLRLIYHDGLIYICVYSEDTDKIIILPFHDVLRMAVTNFSFNASPYYSMLAEYQKNTFGVLPNFDDKVYDIEIEFAGHTGVFVKSMQWHHSQVFETLPNGNQLMRLRCGLNREIIGFIMNFLSNAKVIRPQRLKNMVVERLEGMLDNYRIDSSEFVYTTHIKENALELVG